MRALLGIVIGLLLVSIALQLRLLDVTTKARDTTEETAYVAGGIDARTGPSGTRAAREPVRSLWSRLSDDRDRGPR